VDEPDGHRIEEVKFFPAAAAGDHQVGRFQLFQVLHDAETRDVEVRFERGEGLPVLAEQFIQQFTPGGIRQGFEHGIHKPMIGD